MLPQCYPNYKTVHRRFQQWCRSEVLRSTRLTNMLFSSQKLDFATHRSKKSCHVARHSMPTYANDTHTSKGGSGDAVGLCWLF